MVDVAQARTVTSDTLGGQCGGLRRGITLRVQTIGAASSVPGGPAPSVTHEVIRNE